MEDLERIARNLKFSIGVCAMLAFSLLASLILIFICIAAVNDTAESGDIELSFHNHSSEILYGT